MRSTSSATNMMCQGFGCFTIRAGLSASALAALAAGLLFQGVEVKAGGLMPPQVSNTSGQDYYQNAVTLIDLPAEDLANDLPELSGLVPARDQQELPRLLNAVGASVEESYQKFTEVVADEQVTQVRCGPSGRLTKSVHRRFNYLILARHEAGLERIEEYRAAADGEPGQGLAGDFFSEGFASMWALFYPGNQPGSRFRYLGRQRIGDGTVNVIGCAQRPGWSAVLGFENASGRRILLMYQGVAWIDAATNKIVKMRAELLKPRLDVQLELQTTEIQFGKVDLSDAASTSLWVPLQVTVTTVWNGEVIRNEHQHSNYRLPGSNSKIKSSEEISLPPQAN